MQLLNQPRLGKTAEHLKRSNRRTVLDLARARTTVSRADLARATGMSPQSISNIIADLEAARLIRADGRVYGGKGQPPVAYRIDPAGAAAIGIHLDRCHLRAVLVDASFTVRAARERTPRSTRAGAMLSTVRAAIDELAAASGRRGPPLRGIGIASPRLPDGRVVDLSSFEGGPWDDLRAAGFDQRLADACGLPVIVENDANAGALGEAHGAANRSPDNFSYLFLGRGLGGGCIAGGRLSRGAWRNAGEVGHIVLSPAGGATMESVLSLDALLGRLGVPPEATLTPSWGQVATTDPGAWSGWLADAAPLLRWLLAMIEHIHDPEAVVVGSYLPPPLLQALLDAAAPLLPSVSVRRDRRAPRLRPGALGYQAIAFGAAIAPLLALTEADPEADWAICGPVPDLYAPR